MNLTSPHPTTTFSAVPFAADSGSTAAPTASERVLAAELEARGESHDALSMMVSSVVRMVQAGRTRDSRWKDC